MNSYYTLLFYKYVPLPDAAQWAINHRTFAEQLGVRGRVLVAEEGINGTISGTQEQTEAYMTWLRNDPRLSDLEFKVDACSGHTFNKLYVRHRKELVHFGVPDVDVVRDRGQYVEPEQWVQLKEEPGTIMVDFRNRVEWEVGRFRGALTLPIEHFREVPQQLSLLEPYRNHKILAYCTGGIRCEKATAYLRRNGFEQVFQLHGGIIEYGKRTGGVDFDGKCYVFDHRITVDVNRVNPTIVSHCTVCHRPSARYINCANMRCNKHFILCEECSAQWEGCCSEMCRQSPYKRRYNGTGFYHK